MHPMKKTNLIDFICEGEIVISIFQSIVNLSCGQWKADGFFLK